MDSELWKQNVLAAISTFADREYQERAWTREGVVVSSFTEAVNLLFDDYNAESFFAVYAPKLPHGVELRRLFVELDTLIEQLDASQDDASLIQTAAWDKVLTTAGKLRDLLTTDWPEAYGK